jgi:hypothetical protein
MNEVYLNVSIIQRIIMTVPVTAASAENLFEAEIDERPTSEQGQHSSDRLELATLP